MEKVAIKSTTRVKILACVTSKPSCDDGKAEKTEYECYVCCGDYGDDLPLLKEWLWQCCQIDLDKTRFPSDVLNDRNYARAILALRWFHQCFDDDHHVEYIP